MSEILPFKNQVYEDLKNQHDAQNLFVDQEFPATNKSIYHSGKRVNDVQWHRPTVRFFTKSFTRSRKSSWLFRLFTSRQNFLSTDFNVEIWIKVKSVSFHSCFQWKIISNICFFFLYTTGNCWFIAGASAVTLNPDLLQRVVPPDQSFDDENYAGRKRLVILVQIKFFLVKEFFIFVFGSTDNGMTLLLTICCRFIRMVDWFSVEIREKKMRCGLLY